MSANAIAEFLEAINESIIVPLNTVQGKLSWQKTLRDSPKYKEVDGKLRAFDSAYFRVKENLGYRDRIWEILRRIRATRMTQFLEKGREISLEESQELRAAMEPYLSLLEPVAGIRQLQMTMTGQAKLKKMPLPYDDITATLRDVATAAAQLPQTLQDGVSAMWQSLEQTAAASGNIPDIYGRSA
jgi:hypothetical protein